MDVTSEEQRQAAWDRWGNDVNTELRRIDTWFAAYGYTIPERLGADLQNMLVDLSARISECPGRPIRVVARARFTDEELRAIAATPEDHVIYPNPTSMVDALDELQREENDKAKRAAAMLRFDAALAERARMRRRGASSDWAVAFVSIAAAGIILWWLLDYVAGP